MAIAPVKLSNAFVVHAKVFLNPTPKKNIIIYGEIRVHKWFGALTSRPN